MTQRYNLLKTLVAYHRPETILEFGVGGGGTADIMIREALKHRDEVYYIGYDLFEDATAEDDAREFNVKSHVSQEECARRLAEIKEDRPGLNFQLKKGDTRDETEGVTADFVFIDGGHSVETVANDYELARESKVVVFDDFYEADEDGKSPDTERFGANKTIEEIGAVPFGEGDPVRDGGKVRLAVFPAAAIPKQKMKIASRNCAPDKEIQANIEGAMLRGLPFIQQCRAHDMTAAMCSGGPSLMGDLGEISKYSTSSSRVVCVKHSHDMLIGAGVVPWGCLLLDPRDHVKDFIERPHPEITYLVGTMCHPTTLDRLMEKKAKIRLYHAHVGAGEEGAVRMANLFSLREHNRVREILAKVLADDDSKHRLLGLIDFPRQQYSDKLVGGGTTSAMRGINVLYMLGFRKFRLYGYDSCFLQEPDLTLKTKAGHPKNFTVTVAGREFWTDGELICQYQDLQSLMKQMPDIDIEVSGDGLFQHGFRNLARLPVLEQVI